MRVGDRNVAPGGVEADRARVLAHPAADFGRRVCRHEPCIPFQRDQGDAIPARTLMLHGDDDARVPIDVEMPDRQPAKRLAERRRAHQPTAGGVEHRKRRDHGIQVQLRAAGVGVGADPAVGDREPRAEHANLVRTHAVTGPLAYPSPVPRDVPHSDDSSTVFEPVLGRVEKRPVLAERTVAVEVPALGGGEPFQHRAGRGIHDERPIAGTPGEHDDVAGRRVSCESMSASGEWHVAVDVAGLVEHRGQKSPLPVRPAADEAPVVERAGNQHRSRTGGGESREEPAPTDRRHRLPMQPARPARRPGACGLAKDASASPATGAARRLAGAISRRPAS